VRHNSRLKAGRGEQWEGQGEYEGKGMHTWEELIMKMLGRCAFALS
jgi:hypothetical protein